MGLQGDDLVEFDDVLKIAEHTQDFDLVIKKGLMDLPFHVFHVDEFESEGVSLLR